MYAPPLQTLLPCFLTQAGVSPTMFTPSPDTYVRHAIATLGIRSRICGYWPHAFQVHGQVCGYWGRYVGAQAGKWVLA